jgi:hypothetical protein
VTGPALSRRALLLYGACAGMSLAACDGNPADPDPSGCSERPEPSETGNVRVSRDGFCLHAEPNIAVNPRNPRNLLGACIADVGIAAYASFDGGANWRSHGALDDSGGGRDPTVSFDAHGRGYVCANTDDVHVWRTDDGGRTFARPAMATRGRHLDHPWLAADPTPGPPEATHLYAAWTGGDSNTRLEFTRSTDAGRSFEPPRTVDSAGGADEGNLASPSLAAGPDRTVYIAYGVWPAMPRQGLRPELPTPIRVASSADGGQTWRPPVQLGTAVMEIRVTPDTNVPGLPAVVAHHERPFAAVAFVVRRSGSPVSDIAVCVSTDGGASWTTPRRVPRPSDDTSYTQPQVAIDEAGRLALSAFAHRGGLVDVVLLRASNFSERFGRPEIITSRPFDPTDGAAGGKHGAWWIGDYQGLAAAAGTIWPFWNDPRSGRLEIFTQPVPAATVRAAPE